MREQSGLFIKELEKRMSNQNKLRNLENKRIELVRKIQLCEHYKKEIARFVQELNNQYNQGLISYEEYYYKLSRALEQKTPEQWIKEYDSSIWYYKHNLDSCEREIKKQENKAKIAPVVMIAVIFMILGFGFLFLKPTITGLIIGIGEEAYTQDINLVVNESYSYEWQPEHIGILRSVLVNGKILGEGSIKVYLDDKLVLDSSKLEKSGISMVTGLAISDLAEINESVALGENITNITEGKENITAPEIPEIENITNITQEVPENITIPEEINVSENITLPEDASPGERYSVGVSFKDISTDEEGKMVQTTGRITKSIPVIVKSEEVLPEEEIPTLEEEGKGFPTAVVVLLLVIIVILGYIILKKKK